MRGAGTRPGPRAAAGSGLLALAVALAACQARTGVPMPEVERAEGARAELGREAAELYMEQVRRVLRVSHGLRVAGARACADHVAPILGIDVEQRVYGEEDYPPFHAAVLETYDVDDRVTVVAVAQGSPAERAGVRRGDRILEVQGRKARRVRHVFEALRDEPGGVPRLALERRGRPLTVDVPPVPACATEFWVQVSDVITTGRVPRAGQAFVTTGVVRFVEDDDELAAAIAHELAHHVIGGRMGGYPDDELRADALAATLLGAAGYDPRVLLSLLERLALERPWMIAFEPRVLGEPEPPHGRLAERIVALRSRLEPAEGGAAAE